MGAWLCPLCGHGKFLRERRVLHCARCSYQERIDQPSEGAKARMRNRQKNLERRA